MLLFSLPVRFFVLELGDAAKKGKSPTSLGLTSSSSSPALSKFGELSVMANRRDMPPRPFLAVDGGQRSILPDCSSLSFAFVLMFLDGEEGGGEPNKLPPLDVILKHEVHM